jgi:hypothetical protein
MNGALRCRGISGEIMVQGEVEGIVGWFGWYKSRPVSVESIVFCERE